MPSFRKGGQLEGEAEGRKSFNNFYFIFMQWSTSEMMSQLEKVTVWPESGLW